MKVSIIEIKYMKMKHTIKDFLLTMKFKILKLLASREMFFAELTATSDNKIYTIKEIRSITGLDLKEAKELVENMQELLLKFNKGAE